MTRHENPGAPTLAEIRTEGCRIVDQIREATALINIDYEAASGVLHDRLWPYCHALARGPAQDFLKLQLMNAKEDLGELTSPWGYHWGPDRDRLMETQGGEPPNPSGRPRGVTRRGCSAFRYGKAVAERCAQTSQITRSSAGLAWFAWRACEAITSGHKFLMPLLDKNQAAGIEWLSFLLAANRPDRV